MINLKNYRIYLHVSVPQSKQELTFSCTNIHYYLETTTWLMWKCCTMHSVFSAQNMTFEFLSSQKYSGTSLIRTEKGQSQVSILWRCPYYRSVCKKRFNCTIFKGKIICVRSRADQWHIIAWSSCARKPQKQYRITKLGLLFLLFCFSFRPSLVYPGLSFLSIHPILHTTHSQALMCTCIPHFHLWE